jgi:hypothetical protein
MSIINRGSYPGSSYSIEGNYEKGVTTLNHEGILLLDRVGLLLNHPCNQYSDEYSPRGLIDVLRELTEKKYEANGITSDLLKQVRSFIDQLEVSLTK